MVCWLHISSILVLVLKEWNLESGFESSSGSSFKKSNLVPVWFWVTQTKTGRYLSIILQLVPQFSSFFLFFQKSQIQFWFRFFKNRELGSDSILVFKIIESPALFPTLVSKTRPKSGLVEFVKTRVGF